MPPPVNSGTGIEVNLLLLIVFANISAQKLCHNDATTLPDFCKKIKNRIFLQMQTKRSKIFRLQYSIEQSCDTEHCL